MTSYRPAPEIEAIAVDIISDVDEYSALANVEVRYVWRDPAATSKGRVVLGKARKITGLNAVLASAHDPDLGLFVIEIAEDTWLHLTLDQQRALVDHELAHLYVGFDDETGEMVLSIVGHDVEEFHSVVRRHGTWRPELRDFAEIAGQQRLLP